MTSRSNARASANGGATAEASSTPNRSRHGRVRLAQDMRTGSPAANAAAADAGTSTPQRGALAPADSTPAHAGLAGTSNFASSAASPFAPHASTDGPSSSSATSGKATAFSTVSNTAAIMALHTHLASSLLETACADIRFRVLGRIYSLHRVILVQSSFFHDLLSGEFSEARSRRGVWRAGPSSTGDEAASDAIDLHFDDCNITRPAFEYCIATLYGAAPELVLPSWASPSTSEPLTKYFRPQAPTTNVQADSTLDTRSSPAPEADVPAAGARHGPQHPATPRFLLSLLATAAYLGIPAVVSHAVTLIMCSLTPFTVSHYMRFSLGAGILGAPEAKQRRESGNMELWDWELEGPAWGLASLSEPDYSHIESDTSDSSLVAQTQQMGLGERRAASPDSITSSRSNRAGKESSGTSRNAMDNEVDHSAREGSFMTNDTTVAQRSTNKPHFYYGTQSDRIGEVCSCWLLRWGTDVLLGEEQLHAEGSRIASNEDELTTYGQLPAPNAMTAGDLPRDIGNLIPLPRAAIWCHPRLQGLPAKTARDIISNDGFWVRTEWDRFEVARRVVAMRRAYADSIAVHHDHGSSDVEDLASLTSSDDESADDRTKTSWITKSSSRTQKTRRAPAIERSGSLDLTSEDDADEKEYVRLFSEGVYYTHMSFAELSAISNQVCPSTGLPYTPVNVLQGALWSQSELRNVVVSFDGTSKPSAQAKSLARRGSDGEGGDVSDEQVDTERRSSSGKDAELAQELDLGLTSLEEDFGKACKAVSRRGRASRAHLGEDGIPISLGGVTPSMQLGGTANALKGILSRRFHAVCVDDTIRVGENMFSLATSTPEAPASHGSKDASGTTSRMSEAPCGVAALNDPRTISLSEDVPRSPADTFFGLRNAVKTGKDLGREHLKAERRNESRGTEDDIGTAQLSQQKSGGGGFLSSDVPFTEWTGYEPMRMGLEFYGVDRLMEKQRMYSPSFFYAGSVWNLYVQTVRKPKGLQLGIYLHRQNHNDSLPSPSMLRRLQPPQSTTVQDDEQTQAARSSPQDDQQPTRPRLATGTLSAQATGSVFYNSAPLSDRSAAFAGPVSAGSQRAASSHPYALNPSPSSTALAVNSPLWSPAAAANSSRMQPSNAASGVIPTGVGPHNDVAGGGIASAASAQTAQGRSDLSSSAPPGPGTSTPTHASGAQALAVPYIDQRRVLHAFFSIYCPSPTGTCMTKFSSEPDTFSLSQSWGWKSSSLLGHVTLEDQRLGSAKYNIAETFRCIVTIGLV